jgi:hypothetical protein
VGDGVGFEIAGMIEVLGGGADRDLVLEQGARLGAGVAPSLVLRL